MKISISCRHVESRTPVETETSRYLDKLAKLLKSYAPDLVQFHGGFEKHPRKVEFSYSLNLSLPTGTLHATGEGSDVLASVKVAFAVGVHVARRVHRGPRLALETLQFFAHPGGVGLLPAPLEIGDDALEVGVNGNLEPPLLGHLAQRPRQLEFVNVQHRARIRAPPQNRLAFAVPGKYAVTVSVEQAWRRRSDGRGQAARARETYWIAFFRARQQRSLNGVLHAAEAFGMLGDRSTVEQCMRVAEGLASRAGDSEELDRVRVIASRLADQMPMEEQSGAV